MRLRSLLGNPYMVLQSETANSLEQRMYSREVTNDLAKIRERQRETRQDNSNV